MQTLAEIILFHIDVVHGEKPESVLTRKGRTTDERQNRRRGLFVEAHAANLESARDALSRHADNR